MATHDCLRSTIIEAVIFSGKADANNTEECPICSEKISNPSSFKSCCASYGARLRCGHYAHVICQLCHTSNFKICSSCGSDNYVLGFEHIKKK